MESALQTFSVSFLDLKTAQKPPSRAWQRNIKTWKHKRRNRLINDRMRDHVVEVKVKAPNQYRAQTLGWGKLSETIKRHASTQDFALYSVVEIFNKRVVAHKS